MHIFVLEYIGFDVRELITIVDAAIDNIDQDKDTLNGSL